MLFGLFSSIIVPTLAATLPSKRATFSSKTFFKYVDKSCDSYLTDVNNAGDDMNALVQAAQDSFTWTTQSKNTFNAYWGELSKGIDIDTNSALVKSAYGKLGSNMQSGKYSLYCDGTAFKWVTEQQEGADKGKPLTSGQKGSWYIPEDRRAAGTDAVYIAGTQRADYCAHPDNSKAIAGASAPGEPYVVLCKGAFDLTYKTLSGVKDTAQAKKTNLDTMTSTGAVLLHEFSHAVLSTNKAANNPEIYGALTCVLTAKLSPAKVRKNADTFMLYAMASYLHKNSWVTGTAADLTT